MTDQTFHNILLCGGIDMSPVYDGQEADNHKDNSKTVKPSVRQRDTSSGNLQF